MRIIKYQDLLAETIKAKVKLGGEVKAILRNSMGGIVYESPWTPNLITNTGLVNMGGTPSFFWYSKGHIGSSSTAPAVTDTALYGWLAAHDGGASFQTYYQNTSSPYEIWHTKSYRFNAGTGTGTVREFGLSHQSGNSDMSMRTLISPAVPKAADQVLDIYYKLWLYQDIGDTTGVVSIAGENYNYTLRARNMGVVANRQTLTLAGMDTNYYTTMTHTVGLAAITSSPSTGYITNGNAFDGASKTGGGSGYSDYVWNWGLDHGNDAAGIRTVTLTHNWNGTSGVGFQFSFSRVSDGASVPKDNTKTLAINQRLLWDRH